MRFQECRVSLLPCFRDFPDVYGRENFRLDERELFDEIFHVDACAAEAGHRVDRLTKVDAMETGNDRGNFSANSNQHRINDALESELYILNSRTGVSAWISKKIIMTYIDAGLEDGVDTIGIF